MTNPMEELIRFIKNQDILTMETTQEIEGYLIQTTINKTEEESELESVE